ncbi:hypothetical protein RU09_06005 [Microbacterium sp. MEJ108Y]|uniref:hypothetical protein n=1 Tax=Microbacterium sp. MEJ108Y TaxID=1587523 RepID=UPI0005ACDB59|nr:hypothetical protein [Microbacterium sp. MEJ108Y]KIP93365.1 hypothetical protein RU09_06005 [Microbacterium sp. MEJ108Y]
MSEAESYEIDEIVEIDDVPTPVSTSTPSGSTAETGIGGEVNGDPFERERWLVYDDAFDIQVFQADAEFIATVDGRWLPDAYATRDEAVLAAERSRDGSD